MSVEAKYLGQASFPGSAAVTPECDALGDLKSTYVEAGDGTTLAVDVLLPRSVGERRFTAVLLMTRYWRSTIGGPFNGFQTFYAARGFAVVTGDVRGTGASFGTWPHQRSRAETHDLTAIMDWVVAQPWSDGRIIGIGHSYTANTADWMVERHHPALKAIVPRFADYDPYADLYFPGGVPNTFMAKSWGLMAKDMDLNVSRDANGELSPGVRPVDGPDGPDLLKAAIGARSAVPSVWQGLQQITFRDDRPSTWQGSSMTDFAICAHAAAVDAAGIPTRNWASWMDSGTASGAIHRFLAHTGPLHVVIGPWNHSARKAFDPFQPQREEIAPGHLAQLAEDLSFIRESLDGKWDDRSKRLSYFTCGEGVWRTTLVWPPESAHDEEWHLSPGGTLVQEVPQPGADLYAIDFSVGSGRRNRWITNNDGGPVFYEDRAAIDERLLCYTSAPLPVDTEITGNPVVSLGITSSHDDLAIFVYLEAVASDGRVIYLTEGQLRAIHRRIADGAPLYPQVGPYHSFLREDAMPLVPGEMAEVVFELHPLSVLIPSGHRLRVSLAGADADVFARIPASGDPTMQVHYGRHPGSKIILPIIDRAAP